MSGLDGPTRRELMPPSRAFDPSRGREETSRLYRIEQLVMQDLPKVVLISEVRNFWVKGRLMSYPDIHLEMSWENVGMVTNIPNTPINYLKLWHPAPRSKPVFEFELGRIIGKPSPDDYATMAAPVIMCLMAINTRL